MTPRTAPHAGPEDDAVRTHTLVDPTTWPVRMRPGALRWSRASTHYEATVAFYRDMIGLPVVDRFSSSFGEDGTIFGLPDTAVQMEIVRAHDESGSIGAFDQLVFYLEDAAAVSAATAPLVDADVAPDPAVHAYWAANGAVSYRDPDGRDVVFAPWVYGRDPEPVDQPGGAPGADGPATTLRIDWYTGDRAVLRPLFEAAEDAALRLDAHIDDGRVLAAWRGEHVIGHLQLVETERDGEVEITTMAVLPHHRRSGVGSSLIEAAVRWCGEDGIERLVVGAAAADVGALRFYQRSGFRITGVEHDAFTPASGYVDRDVDGVPLRDRVWLTRDLS